MTVGEMLKFLEGKDESMEVQIVPSYQINLVPAKAGEPKAE
jgi:hypothetical protein